LGLFLLSLLSLIILCCIGAFISSQPIYNSQVSSQNGQMAQSAAEAFTSEQQLKNAPSQNGGISTAPQQRWHPFCPATAVVVILPRHRAVEYIPTLLFF
jgi:hypothetical protein